MSQVLLLVGLVVLGAFLGVVAVLLLRRKEGRRDNSFLMLQSQINESGQATRDQLAQSAQLIRDITRELTQVKEGQKQVMNVTEQLRSLQDILKNPKQRGVLGEYYLETVLKNVLPPGAYELQYGFRDGAKVDAIIKTKQGFIPIDSKFSLENYNRILEASSADERQRYENAFAGDLKIRVDETAKYVRPEEGTLEFAFMFIPSEAVYYDLLVNKVGAIKANTVSLVEYAAGQKKVIIVSPTTLLAYLQTVLQGLRALQIEEAAKKIGERVRDLSRHLVGYQVYHQKLGSHLLTAVNMYDRSSKEFQRIDKDVLKITGESSGFEPKAIDKPDIED